MIVIIYIATALISIIIGVLLFQASRMSGQARIQLEKKKDDYLGSTAMPEGNFKEIISNELSGLVFNEEQGNRLSEKITTIFDKEVKKKIDLSSQEISNKYSSIIQEKAQHEEIAWNKYNKILSEKKQTEAVIRSIAEGLVVVDSAGKVMMMNPAAEKLLGVSQREKSGKTIMEDVKEEQLFSMVKTLPGKGADKEIEIVSPENETRKILRASSAIIENEDGQTVGMVSVLSDITKQKELDRLKSSFVAGVSHELRTPLVAMEKSITLLLSGTTGALSETQQQFLTIAERNLQRLSRLINDLLDLSKLESGKMEMRRQPASIEQIIDDTILSLENWAKTKSIELKKIIPDLLPQVSVDSDRITQVLINLIGNAIKFTPREGRITIQAVSSKQGNEIEVSVADNGIGIAKENLGKVFDKFYQVGERTVTDISGTGIGLSIAKEITQLHGGRIWVESEKGQGAKFIFTLPLN